MYRQVKSVSTASLFCLSLVSPFFISGTSKASLEQDISSTLVLYAPPPVHTLSKVSAPVTVWDEAASLYQDMELRKAGLSRQAFEYAWKGYKYLQSHGRLNNQQFLSICDFSQSSRRKRLYIIDVVEHKLVINTYVAHGQKSGREYASSFSNSMESHKSSLGFYVTGKTYQGEHGLSLRMEGMERGVNDKAKDRNIVIHGCDYAGNQYLKYNRFLGRSYGCPAIPVNYTKKVIQKIRNGSCVFIYHPTKYYLTKSRILNG